MQYRRPACAVHADRSQAKGVTFFFTVITCKRKSILCHEAIVALIPSPIQVEDRCGRPMPVPYLIRGRGMNHPRYRFWLVLIRHVAMKHTLRIRAFVLLPDHTCLRSARRQVHGICTFDVNVGHEWFNLLDFTFLTQLTQLFNILWLSSNRI